jgi:LacI family transcriptional regulator
MSKPTVHDISRLSGLSTATVDRVLNDRSGVSQRARDKVATAVRELGYGKLPVSLSAETRGMLRFLFLIPSRRTGFVRSLEAAIRSAPSALNDVKVETEIRRVGLGDGRELIEILDSASLTDQQGIALFALDAPGVKQAIERAIDRGIAVVTIVSDVAGAAQHYVGIDNVSAGRMAGKLLGRFVGQKTGKIAVICGSMQLRDHLERVFGFRQSVAAHFSNLEVLTVSEGNSDPETNNIIMRGLLAEHPDLLGIYSAGGGNTGILHALAQAKPNPRPVIVLHELTPNVRDALSRDEIDVVLSQDTNHIARSAMRVLRALCLDLEIIPSQEKIRIDVFLADNLP